jgi:ActR/RegA family two-component response regulator/c-di-GMP-binding flagellar brake protein YcgR
VLVADSDYGFARRLRAELESRGCAVEVVSDGLSAINMVKAHPFHGVVLDVDLMMIDGLQVLGIIGTLDRALPVVVTGEAGQSAAQRQAKMTGAIAYFAKPCEPCAVATALLESERVARGGGSPRARPAVTLVSPQPGQALLIECPGGQVPGRWPSKLLARHSASLTAAAPEREGASVSLPFGTRVNVGFPRADGWYQFETYVLGATIYRAQPAVLLAQPKLVSHIQRRRHLRTHGAFNVELRAEHRAAAATGQDAGEGGIRVLADDAFPIGSQVMCCIEPGAPGPKLTVSGTVIWTEEMRDNGRRYRAGIQFAATPPVERRRLRDWLQRLAQPGQEGGDSRQELEL